nr:hypothetical protein [Nitrosomonas nitrosa]
MAPHPGEAARQVRLHPRRAQVIRDQPLQPLVSDLVVVPDYQKLPAPVSVLFPDRSRSSGLIIGEQFSVDPVDVPPGLSGSDALDPPALAVISIAPADSMITLPHVDVGTI